MIVCKFGGSSLADAGQVRKVADIVRQSPQRQVVVVSAPGKRRKEDEKITDILFSCHAAASRGEDIGPRFSLVRERYTDLAAELGIETDISPVLDEVEQRIRDGADQSAVVSRGEYLGAHLVASFLGYEFVDAAELIRFSDSNTVDDAATDALVQSRLRADTRYVVPGFYGAFADGRVQLFSRGGSDISAALIARAAGAEAYENWTDVSGLLSADPRIVENPAPITQVSYRELRELAYLGANVFHEEAVAPVAEKSIPIHIRNTNEPDHVGTTIADETQDEEVAEADGARGRVSFVPATGVAGRTGFRSVLVERPMLSKDPRYADRVRAAFAEAGVPVRHAVSGSDSMLVVCPGEALENARESLRNRLFEELDARNVEIGAPMAIVGVVQPVPGVQSGLLSRIVAELDEGDTSVRYVSVGESPHTMVFGVDEDSYEQAVRAVYRGARP
ncbi:MAG: aspartate kinase [Spirochaetota bacterium]